MKSLTNKILVLFSIVVFAPTVRCQECIASDSTSMLRVLIMKRTTVDESIQPPTSSRLFIEVRQKGDDKFVAEAEISHPIYRGDIYADHSLKVMPQGRDRALIAFQTSFGGDGEHTSNILILYELRKQKLSRLYLDQLIDVAFLPDAAQVEIIHGRRIISLCDVCDGDDAADPTLLFYVPVAVKLEGKKTREICMLTRKEKAMLLERFMSTKNQEIETQRGYSLKQGSEYTMFAEKTERTLRRLLSLK